MFAYCFGIIGIQIIRHIGVFPERFCQRTCGRGRDYSRFNAVGKGYHFIVRRTICYPIGIITFDREAVAQERGLKAGIILLKCLFRCDFISSCQCTGAIGKSLCHRTVGIVHLRQWCAVPENIERLPYIEAERIGIFVIGKGRTCINP